MEAAQFAGGLDIADAPFNKVDHCNLPLGWAIDIEMNYRPPVHKDILDLPISLIGRTQGEKIVEFFAFGADFHGLDGYKKRFVLQAQNHKFFINNIKQLKVLKWVMHTFT
jgi:hypothetical protein